MAGKSELSLVKTRFPFWGVFFHRNFSIFILIAVIGSFIWVVVIGGMAFHKSRLPSAALIASKGGVTEADIMNCGFVIPYESDDNKEPVFILIIDKRGVCFFYVIGKNLSGYPVTWIFSS